MDLRDLWRPGGGRSGLTWRLVKVLIDGLPPESLTKTATRDSLTPDELADLASTPSTGHGPWSHLETIAAAQYDVLQQIQYVLTVVHGGKPDTPKPWPRPGVGMKRRLPPAARTYLDDLAAQHEQRRREAGL